MPNYGRMCQKSDCNISKKKTLQFQNFKAQSGKKWFLRLHFGYIDKKVNDWLKSKKVLRLRPFYFTSSNIASNLLKNARYVEWKILDGENGTF